MDNMTLTAEIEDELIKHLNGQRHGMILKCADCPKTLGMLCYEKYVGLKVTAVRKQVDQLDQVTVWWN